MTANHGLSQRALRIRSPSYLPPVRFALIQITMMTTATISNSTAIRIQSFLQRHFETFGQRSEIFRRVEVD